MYRAAAAAASAASPTARCAAVAASMSAPGGGGAGPSSAAAPAPEEAPVVDRAKHPSGIVPQLQNVVATVDLGCRLELKDIALHARNAEYNPKARRAPLLLPLPLQPPCSLGAHGCSRTAQETLTHINPPPDPPLQRFAAVIMRIREPKTTALIFASGKMVCTGAKSEAESRLAAKKYCRIVQRTGFEEVKMKVGQDTGDCTVRLPSSLIGHGRLHPCPPPLTPAMFCVELCRSSKFKTSSAAVM